MRHPNITEIEHEIQKRSPRKDPRLRIQGMPKKFLFSDRGYKVYAIDQEWIKNNLDVNFSVGGHGRVHSFIPHDEIWIDGKRTAKYNGHAILHEMNEHKEMKRLPYWHAHKSSQEEEYKQSARANKYTELLKKAS